MNLSNNIIITDTNIITDLSIACVLDKFIQIDGVYVIDLIKYDEFNEKTAKVEEIEKIKTINADSMDVNYALEIAVMERKLSFYDCLNFVLAKRKKGILATGDNRLRTYALKNGVTVIRTLKIIELMYADNVMTLRDLQNGLKSLLDNNYTRIPKNELLKLINKYK